MKQDPTHPTGVAETSSHTQMETVAARDRKADAAVEMYVEKNKTLPQVCKKLGYPSTHAALAAIERRLVEHLRESPRSQAAIREMASRRLERILRPVMSKAEDPNDPEHLVAVARAESIIEKYVRLHGAQAPAQIVVSSPTSEKIELLAQQIKSQGAKAVEGGDIFGDDADDSEVLALEQRRQDVEDDVVDAVLVDEEERIAEELDSVDR